MVIFVTASNGHVRFGIFRRICSSARRLANIARVLKNQYRDTNGRTENYRGALFVEASTAYINLTISRCRSGVDVEKYNVRIYKMDGIGLFHTFLQAHQAQLQSSGVPKIFWEVLFKKLKNQIFDAGVVFELVNINYDDDEKCPTDPIWMLLVSTEYGIAVDNPNDIYLVDHAWTYDITRARQHLLQIPSLLDRMCCLMGYDTEKGEHEKVDFVMNEMWRYNQSYSINRGAIEDGMPIWYIMDELGSAVNHSDEPNFRMVPFLYLPEEVTYTLLFPIKDADFGEQVMRDFVERQSSDPKKRSALLLPWVESDFSQEKFNQTEPEETYFPSYDILDVLPREDTPAYHPDENKKLKVFAPYSSVKDYLSDPMFEVVENQEQADILWYTSHFKKYRDLSIDSPRVFVNQFPCDDLLTMRDFLPIICRRKGSKEISDDTLETTPTWLPATYSLNTELIEFIAYFQNRAKKGLDNHWICKPVNVSRGFHMHITNNLFHILRIPSTGPNIVQKYVSSPVLYDRPEVGLVKFDIRYILLLKSVKPLEAYAYANFILKFANKEFILDNFDDYDQHFTVMNYSDDTSFCHLKCTDFMLEWEKQYPEQSWKKDIELAILQMLREVLEAAVSEKPPRGIGEYPQSRSVYAVDLILEWRNEEMKPMLLDVNFFPDCEVACACYRDFYNDIFNCLFRNIKDPKLFHDLSTTATN